MQEHTKTAEEVKILLNGPVNSLPTPFLPDGEIDWDGVRKIIDVGIEGGSGVSLLTYGDSQFDFLSDAEVEALTTCLVDQVRGRALTVAATRRWSAARAVDFAHFCRQLGVDVLMVLPSDHIPASGKIGHYRAIAEVMPVMLVGFPPHDFLDALTDAPNICCFKEDGAERDAVDTMQRYGKQWKCMTGGGLWRNFTQWPWRPAFFCFFSSFAPHVASRYWQATQAGDVDVAGEMIREVELPFAQLADGIGGNFQALWRAALELNGVASRWMRSPALTVAEEDLEKISHGMTELGLITNPR